MKRAKILNRKRIHTTFKAIYEFPLTIVEAPMGFGKTTAVMSFLEEEKIQPHWISIKASDDATALFWEKLSTSIFDIDQEAGSSLKMLGFPTDVPQINNVLQILNNIEFKTKMVIVFDDFHLSQNSLLQKLIFQLAAEEIDGLHYILITRDTSNLDFVELLSKGLCHVISHQQLKFTEEEIQDYCALMNDTISSLDLKRINEYTDGWISFIYLILLGLEKGIPIGMSMTIEELIEKVLFNAYDANIQDFLLKLSIMDDFTAKQAEFVTQNEDTHTILKKLSRENAFVFYDDSSKTYKIHNVLLDFLRLEQSFSKDKFQELYCLLGKWHLDREEFLTAYGYLNRAGEIEKILSHLNNPTNIRNELLKFEGCDEMFDNIPREMLFNYPLAYLQHIFHSLVLGKENSILNWDERLNELEEYYKYLDTIDENYRNRILGELLIVRKFTLFNHLAEIKASNDEIIRLLNGKQSYIAFQNDSFTFGSPHYIYLYYRDESTLKSISEQLSESVGYAKFSNGCGTGGDSLSPAEYALETGHWKNIETNSRKAVLKAELHNQTSIIICAKFNLIRYYIYEGKIAEALEMLDTLEQYTLQQNNSICNTTIDICKGYIYACLCQPEKIPYWLQTGDMTTASFYHQGIGFNYLVYGKALLALKDYTRLEILTEQFHQMFSLYNNCLGLIHNQILKAAAASKLYGVSTGAELLESALIKAEADWLVMPFTEYSPHILEMMEIVVKRNSDKEFYKLVLSACRKYNQSINSISFTPVSLSQREIDVLALAAEGLNRKEISEKLFISQGTVKTHFKNIYLKLEVNSKVTAIKIAQERGYIA